VSVEVQYRVVVAKGDERVLGADDAAVVVSVPAAVVAPDDFDATVAYMRGTLKATGHTGVLLDALRSGAADRALRSLR
jgi:hypothetical protein